MLHCVDVAESFDIGTFLSITLSEALLKVFEKCLFLLLAVMVTNHCHHQPTPILRSLHLYLRVMDNLQLELFNENGFR